MRIDHLSVSRLSCFESCPYKYRLRYHDKVKPLTTSPAAEFGKWIHKGFEIHVRDGVPLKEILKSNIKDYRFGDEYLKEVPKILRNFDKFNKDLDPGETELEFSLDIGAKVPMVGVIDRIIGDDFLTIVDYKTGSFEKSRAKLQNDPQLMTYAYAANKLRDVEYRKMDLSLFYLRSGRRPNVTFPRSRVEEFMQTLPPKIEKIIDMSPEDAKPKINHFCKWCEYAPACKAFQTFKKLRNNNQR